MLLVECCVFLRNTPPQIRIQIDGNRDANRPTIDGSLTTYAHASKPNPLGPSQRANEEPETCGGFNLFRQQCDLGN
jgi:hypothetical protein